MKRFLLGLAALGAAAAATAVLVHLARERRGEWTTDSPAALAAFEEGLAARMKLYGRDAQAAFRRALELDPDFAAPRLMLLDTDDKAMTTELVRDLRAYDTTRLTERERFLVAHALDRLDHDEAAAAERIDRYIAAHPRDPWGHFLAGARAWESADRAAAETIYARLLEIDPNWVVAHNHLGYLAMAEGRFADAETHFRTYAFVAPDQANPHDSLGELLMLLGRYDEARAALELALEIRPDFCASYGNLFTIAMLERRQAELEPLLARVRTNCAPRMAESLACVAQMVDALFTGDWDAPWRDGYAACLRENGERGVFLHRMALLAGRQDEARLEEEFFRERAAKTQPGNKDQGPAIVLLHLEGVRDLAERRPQGRRRTRGQGEIFSRHRIPLCPPRSQARSVAAANNGYSTSRRRMQTADAGQSDLNSAVDAIPEGAKSRATGANPAFAKNGAASRVSNHRFATPRIAASRAIASTKARPCPRPLAEGSMTTERNRRSEPPPSKPAKPSPRPALSDTRQKI